VILIFLFLYAGCSRHTVRILLRSCVPSLRPGEDGVPARVLQYDGGAAGDVGDEPPLVPEDLQGDGQGHVQRQPKSMRQDRLGLG
jgi:hypothetical protein